MPTPDQIKEYFSLLAPLFDALQKLGVKGWEMALRQNYIYVVQDAIVLLFVTAIFLIVLHMLRKGAKNDYKWIQVDGEDKKVPYSGILDYIVNEDTDRSFGMLVFLIICTAIWAAFFFGESFPMINRLLNPEWTTLQDVVALLRGMSGK